MRFPTESQTSQVPVIIANLPIMKAFLACVSRVAKDPPRSLHVPIAASHVDLVGTILKQVSCNPAVHPAPHTSPAKRNPCSYCTRHVTVPLGVDGITCSHHRSCHRNGTGYWRFIMVHDCCCLFLEAIHILCF